MTQIVSFEDYQPSPRYDGTAWSVVYIEEGTASVGPWTVIDTQAVTPADADPSVPAYRNFTTAAASDDADLWYRLTFYDAAGAFGQPTFPVQNAPTARPVYATTTELAQLLRVRESDRHVALRRVLESAAMEIDKEIGNPDIDGTTLPYSSPPAIVSEVSLERAVEHWQQMQSPFGVIGLGEMATHTARNSWDRHAEKLAVLKGSWALA